MIAPATSDSIPPRLVRLPPSLRRIANLLAAGLSEKQIAVLTGLSHNSVRTYVSRLYRRLDVHNRAQLVSLLLTPPRR